MAYGRSWVIVLVIILIVFVVEVLGFLELLVSNSNILLVVVEESEGVINQLCLYHLALAFSDEVFVFKSELHRWESRLASLHVLLSSREVSKVALSNTKYRQVHLHLFNEPLLDYLKYFISPIKYLRYKY